MAAGKVDLVITGADRVVANGDAANKIGTYGLAVLARHHKVPFYIAAPVSTIDSDTHDGGAILIDGTDGIIVQKGQPIFKVTPDEKFVETDPAAIEKERRERTAAYLKALL